MTLPPQVLPRASDPAPHTFRDSVPGRLWQERHFQRILALVGPHADAASMAAARAYLGPVADGAPAAEMAAFVQEVAWGAAAQHALVTRLVSQPPASYFALHDHQTSLAVPLVSQMEVALLALHETVQACFLKTLQATVLH